MSDDLKINLPTNLSVDVQPEPVNREQNATADTCISGQRAATGNKGEARESTTKYSNLAERRKTDSRGAQNSLGGSVDVPAALELRERPLSGTESEILPTSPVQTPSLRPSPISGVTPPVEYRWKKGCPSPNPGGKPRGLQKAYIKHLAETDETGETNADKIAKAQIKKASSEEDDGSTAAAREIRQATETDDEAGKSGGFNIGSLNVAILQQITRAATEKSLE